MMFGSNGPFVWIPKTALRSGILDTTLRIRVRVRVRFRVKC